MKTTMLQKNALGSITYSLYKIMGYLGSFLLIATLIIAVGCTTNPGKIQYNSGTTEPTGPDLGGGSFSASVGSFKMGSILGTYFSASGSSKADLILADGEICCKCNEPGVDSNIIEIANIPVAAGSYDSTTNTDLKLTAYSIKADGSTGDFLSNATDVKVTVQVATTTSIAGYFSATLSTGQVLEGTFKGEPCN